jgi:glucoamylase
MLDIAGSQPCPFALMMRNMASTGVVFVDPHAPESSSRPGCIIASPSYWTDLADTQKQDYVYYWKRDGAIAAMEIAAPGAPMDPEQVKIHLTDYINFAKLCQDAAPGDQAKFTIDGEPFPSWPLQSDGPALQTLALIRAFPGSTSRRRRQHLRSLTRTRAFFLTPIRTRRPACGRRSRATRSSHERYS